MIDGEAVLAHDDLAPRSAVGQAELIDQVIRACAADNALRIETETHSDRPAQVAAVAVWIAEQLPFLSAIGLLSAGRYTEGPFVGG